VGDRGSKTIQIVIPWIMVKEELGQLHGGSSGRHLGVIKTLDRVRLWCYWLHGRSDVERKCQQCDICAASWSLMNQYNIATISERITIHTGPFQDCRISN
jgi:hypothetical protein